MSENGNGFKLEITKEVEGIKGHIDVLRIELSTQIKDLKRQLDRVIKDSINHTDGCSVLQSHLEYHTKNEYKFGIWALLKRRPLLAIVIGILLSSAYGIGVSELLLFVKRVIM